MVLEHEILPFLDWLLPGEKSPYGALALFLVLAAVAAVLGVILGFILSVIRHGPLEASYNVAQVIADGVSDFAHASAQRTMALARLAVKESIRGRVIVVFIVFAVVLMYARWFLDRNPDNPTRLYISFVMTATKYLVLLMALFLSALSLPADIKNRTIYTVVTKPVRALEIVLGRIVGFSIVGTVILLVMCLISYLFVVVGLSHTHTVDEDAARVRESLQSREVSELAVTSLNAGHRHRIAMDAQGELYLDDAAGHTHDLKEQDGRLISGAPKDQFQARVPRYGELRFLNSSGGPGDGINVGHEWTYRRYVEGRTLAGAVWTFDGITPDQFGSGLPLEMTLGVYRTHKGNIEEGILGSLEVRSPDGQARSVGIPFVAKEYQTQKMLIPRELDVITTEGQRRPKVDMFEELVQDGKVEILVRCEAPAQYFGMAQADLYVLSTKRSFFVNFVKAYFGLWMQMVIVIAFGVTLSTILSAPIALLGTFAILVIGHFSPFINGVLGSVINANEPLRRLLGISVNSENVVEGGGPIESTIRMLTQMNVSVELDLGWLAYIIRTLDLGIMSVLALVAKVVPNFGAFDTSDYLAYGFNINFNLIAQQLAVCGAFLISLLIAGYFLLKTREIAA